MNSYLGRKLLKITKWTLLLMMIPVIYILLSTFARPSSEDENFGTESDHKKEEQSILDVIRNKHLIQYNPNAPTNYSSGRYHKGWKQMMSHEVAKRLNYKMNGFFVECGALDGIFLSNTLLLETMYRWTGLLVEADPASASVLKTRNRHAWVADVCLSPNPFPIQVEMLGHGKVFELSYIKNDVVGNQRKYDTSYNRKIQVQCYPLAMLMEALNRTEIDYFSLDVEGLELDILTTIPFDKIHIKLISVEVRPGNKKSVQDFLEPLGFKRVRQIKSDTEFMHDDLYEFMLK